MQLRTFGERKSAIGRTDNIVSGFGAGGNSILVELLNSGRLTNPLHLEIPEPQYRPALGLVVGIDFLIPLHIPLDLGDPEFRVGFDGMFAMFPVVAMPEGAVDEDDQFVFFQADVGLAEERFLGGFVPDTGLPEGFLEELFRLGSPGADAGHCKPEICISNSISTRNYFKISH
jgi:hypothetical protein